MSRENPFEELDRLFDRLSRLPEPGGADGPPVDILDRSDAFVVTVDLPGYDRESIDVTVSGDRLTVVAERERERESASTSEAVGGQYVRRERRHERRSRELTLPETVDEEGAEATYEGGILTVTLPKRDPAEESHRIEVD
jgi:HSP20 family protein